MLAVPLQTLVADGVRETRRARGWSFLPPRRSRPSRSSPGHSRADGPAGRPSLCCAVRSGSGPFQERKRTMRTLGYATAISLALGGVALAALAVKALPDARRYLKMRSI